MAQASSTESRALFEIRRLLSELGLATQFTARGDALRGQLVLGAAIENHFGGPSISHATFTIRPDGVLDVDDPPALRGLSAAGCQRLDSIARLVSFIGTGFEQRVSRIHALWSRLRSLGVKAEVDPERMVLEATVDLDAVGCVTLEGSEQHLVARQVVPWVGNRTPVPMDDAVVDLQEIADRVDLELILGTHAEKALAERSGPSPRKKARAPTGASSPAPAGAGGAPTLERVVTWLGPGAILRPGSGVARTLHIDGRELQFSAEHREGETFDGKLVGASGVIWQGRFDLEGELRLEQFARDRLANGDAGQRVAGGAAMSEDEAELVDGLLPPSPNEIWVMDVRVQEDDGVEVRFRGVNIAGNEFGPTRAIPKANFEASFVAATHGYRMVTRVIEAAEESVTYQRLDARREPLGAPKTCPLTLFLLNFTAEAAAY